MTKLLVTGAAGHLGRRVVEVLIEAKAGEIIATTRSPDKLADLAARGVDVRAADFDDRASLDRAFSGAERLLLISTNTLDVPGKRLAQHRNAVAAAVGAGVRHIAYTSAPAPYPTPESSLINDHFWTEAAIFGADVDWTILRDNIYADYTLPALAHAVASGQLFSATKGGARNYVSREDCARAAAGALASAKGRQVFDIGGTAPVTQDELAAIASELTGRAITHVNLAPDALRAGLVQSGLPGFLADALVAFDVDASEGKHAVRTDAIQALTGRPPTSLRDFLVEHRSAFSAA
ncbi:MAG: NAD(P)H-binding protein [Alphaproteobacteria bacterium]